MREPTEWTVYYMLQSLNYVVYAYTYDEALAKARRSTVVFALDRKFIDVKKVN